MGTLAKDLCNGDFANEEEQRLHNSEKTKTLRKARGEAKKREEMQFRRGEEILMMM